MGFESAESVGYVDYFERLSSLLETNDECLVKKVMDVLCGDGANKQSVIEDVIGRGLSKENLSTMMDLTECFLCKRRREISFEDVELFDILFTQGEKRNLLEMIRKNVDLEKELAKALSGWKMYFMRWIIDNSRVFEYFLVHQLFPDKRVEARRLIQGENGSMGFVKYMDSDGLSLMKGSKVIDLEKTSDVNSTHAIRGEYPLGSSVRYEDGVKIVSVPGRSVRVEFDGQAPDNVKRLFGNDFMFNYIQSVVQDSILKRNGNVLVCAPTGSGKTVIGIMSILREIERRERIRVGYIVPMKALAREMCKTISKALSDHDTVVVEHTSDVYSGYNHLEKAGVIVSTPEKFDVLTRNTDLQFDLMIIDEIHIVGDTRGGAIEAIVARMSMGGGCRIVGLSATLPNYMDIGRFIRCDDSDIFHFGPEFRKSAIDYEIINVGMKEREMSMTVEKVLENLESNGPILVFVHSRGEALEVANEIKRYMERMDSPEVDVSPNVQGLLKHRVGIHHAGLDRKTRVAVEDLYRDGKIDVMVSTATLAWGVNLPGKTVIIKGTEVYDASYGWKPVKQIEMIQMFGRAGRFEDDRCKGVLISSKENEFLVQRSIDSKLLPNLCDCLNAEIVRGMRKFEEMIDWFKYTFYYTRLVKMSREPGKMVKDLVYSALRLLEDSGLVILEPCICPTTIGEISSRYYIHYRDAKRLFDEVSQIMMESSLFRILERTREFSDLKIDQKEMETLKELVPIPTESPFGILVQCYIANRMDSSSLSQNLCRMFRVLFEIGIRKRLGISKMILGWCKASEHRIFPYQTPLRHFACDKDALRNLEMKEIPFGMIEILGKEGLDEIGVCGNSIIEYLKYVPKFNILPSLRVSALGHYIVSIGIEKAFDDSMIHSNTYYLFITDSMEEKLIVYDAIIFERGCEYISQNYGLCTSSPFVNVCLLSSHYLCPTEPIPFDLRNTSRSALSIFSAVWESLMMKKVSRMNNYIKLGLFHNEISTEVVIVPNYSEKRRLMLLGYKPYTYEEFVSWRVSPRSATILEVHDIVSNHLIEACIVQCIMKNIQMVLAGLPFTVGGGIELIGSVEKNLKEPKVEIYESSILGYHGMLSNFRTRLSLNTHRLNMEKYSCLIICSTSKVVKHFKKFFKDARIALEYTGIKNGMYFTTKRTVDLWIDRKWNPQVDQIHMIGTDYYDYETSSWVDYSLADVKRYSLLGSKVFLYLKQSKKALYFSSENIPLYYCSSGRRELYMYSYWLGCEPEKSMECPLFVKDRELTRYGMVLCKYCVGMDTIEMFNERIKDKMGLKSIQALVCRASEAVLDMDTDEFEALSRAGVDLSAGKVHGVISYVLRMSGGDEWVFQQYEDKILPVMHRLYLCTVEISLEKMCLKTAFNAMFGLQNMMKVFSENKDKFYNAKLCGGIVLIEVISMPRSPMGCAVFFLFDGSKESSIMYADCPGTYSISWKHGSCYVMSDSYPGFETIEDGGIEMAGI
ncbi:pre-mRNA splicing helicase [Encephalitozoon romaleae SJ-2008]|uniref:Pre-mRNA splicing helicase n=1 Tax=Encephalitozoon romaleae (strain SJ-2008) TaxID=1178016 RepID=I7AN72_ENCRO|nr:pre-mRNA splicing helicase [Encephalitozoon romaleae SJ-2008]AFN83179.1 pre-mRNA splicing helicase [Encephalitozoon romaleae SJ-2008]